jgi:superfamily II DNA/RNA helicase
MQETAIEALEENDELVLLSATGSGKTLAFLLPVLSRLSTENRETQALIITPSRELALQIEQVFKTMGTGHKITCCYGGHKRETEENNLIQPPAVIVGTPGRLADHIRRGNITVNAIETLVLDEFDKSLELGFTEEISFIIASLPQLKRRILTSATKAEDIPAFVGLNRPVELNFLDPEQDKPEALALKSVYSPDKDKLETLFRLLCFLGNKSSIIFCNHKESVERCSAFLKEKGIANEFYHGSLEQRERDSALCKFRNGSVNFLVTTDLAARGLDIPFIRYIIHYHLPHTEDIFTHRNGRTARQEASGTAILILSDEDRMPSYINDEVEPIQLPGPTELSIPDRPKWTTLYFSAGKKNKVNKVDIVGFLSNRGHLKQEDIGLIEVKDFSSFAAVRRSKVGPVLESIKEQKLKNKKVRIEVAK